MNAVLLATLFVVAAIRLLTSGPSTSRFSTSGRLTGSRSRVGWDPGSTESARSPSALEASAVRRRWLASLVAAVAAWSLIGGLTGVGAGALLAVSGPVLLSRLETRAVRQTRNRLVADAPQVADLLAACLSAGTTMPAALSAVSSAMREPTAGHLRRALAQMELGADPAAVWAAVAREPALAPIGRAALRSDTSGSPLATTLSLVAEDLRREHRVRVEISARSVGVRAVGPLGACFLPAFLLLGVVPLVGSLVQGVLP
ncbi:MAG: type II secretion system F family protein [Candidatus Nanopelagicales bacterium]|nr:type II secretion system F family protein [Candidatus Nanopelagicales bacterium]